MKLYTNGCSFTYGTGEVHDENGVRLPASKETWPYYSELPWDEIINDSISGGSNDRIVRTTMEWLDKNKDSINDTTFIIQWTMPFRKEYYNNMVDTFIHVANGHDNTVGIGFEHDIKGGKLRETNLYKLYKQYVEKYFMHVTSEQNIIVEFYKNILLLQHTFEKHNAKYLFTSLSAQCHPFQEFINIYLTGTLSNWQLDIINVLKKEIDQSKWSSGTLSNYMERNFISQEDKHPNKDGHKLISKRLFEDLERIYGTTRL